MVIKEDQRSYAQQMQHRIHSAGVIFVSKALSKHTTHFRQVHKVGKSATSPECLIQPSTSTFSALFLEQCVPWVSDLENTLALISI